MLLAAGSATRFGGHKILARLPGGESIGARAAQRLLPAVDQLLIIVRAGDAAAIAHFAAAGFSVIECADAGLGMGHSLGCGVRASAGSAGWLVGLGDMPYIETATIAALAAHFRASDAIVVPRHDGRAGHPVVFPARFGVELAALAGDQGARGIVAAHAADVRYLDVADAGIVRDIDVPGDLAGSE